MKKMRIIELFAGIGACSKALENIGQNIEIVDAIEIDKYAIKSFNAIHNTNFEARDISKYNEFHNNIDIITHGSPCQDFSIAGKQAGGDLGSGTRSSLLYETLRIVGQVRPKYILWENVKNILSKKHKHNFDKYIDTLNTLGYNSYYKVLNAKDYGIPQNRERIFTVSIRKDIDVGNFRFPEKEELKLRLKDMLESEVEEKYYLSEKMISFFYKNEQKQKEKGNGFRFGVSDGNIIAKAVTTRAGGRMDDNFIRCIQIGNLDIKGHDSIKRIYSQEGLSPTLTDMRGRVGHQVSQTLTVNNNMAVLESKERIRKLTPKECWRLMGFSDEDFEKAANIPTSNTQLYKQAGNSIVVKVLEKIFINLIDNKNKEKINYGRILDNGQISLF